MATIHKTLLALVAAVLVLTGCTNNAASEPDQAENTQVVDDAATETSPEPSATVEQETLRPSSPAPETEQSDEAPTETETPEPTFQEVALQVFTGEPLPNAVPGECHEGATPRCFSADSMVYDKCVVDPYGSGQAACPVGSLDDVVVIDAGMPGFDPQLSYTEASGQPLGFAEVRSQVSGETMFCTPRTGGAGFDGPEPYTMWVGNCTSPDITDEATYIYWFGSMEAAEAGNGYVVDPTVEQPEIAYTIHGPGFDENEIRFGDVITWYY